jgi:hypothetical protein
MHVSLGDELPSTVQRLGTFSSLEDAKDAVKKNALQRRQQRLQQLHHQLLVGEIDREEYECELVDHPDYDPTDWVWTPLSTSSGHFWEMGAGESVWLASVQRFPRGKDIRT